MENNLIYIENSIFTKNPYIYLNLNTSAEKNFNVEMNTNLNNLHVNNKSYFKNLITSENIYNNQNIFIKGNSIFNGTINTNNNIILNHNENSSHYNNGSLIIKGGVGIHKKVNIGDDVKLYKNVNIDGNLNINTNTFINKNLTVNSNTNIYDNLYILNNIIGSSNLILKNNAFFEKNLSIYGNLVVHGKRVNILSEQILIGDPLVVFGFNQTKTTSDNSLGGFIISYNNNNNRLYSGLVRHPNTKNYHLYNDLIENKKTDISIDYNNINKHINYSNLYLYNLNIFNDSIIDNNLNIKNNLYIKGNTLIEQNIDIYGNTIIKQNVNILGNLNIKYNIHNNGNTKIDNLLNTRLLLVKEISNFIGNINTNNININGISNIYNNLNIHGLTHITKNTIISNNLNIKKGNVYIDNLLNSRLLKITENTNLLGNLNINAISYIYKNLNIFSNLNIKKGEIYIDTKLNTKNLIVSHNGDFKDNLNVYNINIQNYKFNKWLIQPLDTNITLPINSEIVPITYGGTSSTNPKEFRENFYIKIGSDELSKIKTDNIHYTTVSNDLDKRYFQPYSSILSTLNYIHNTDPNEVFNENYFRDTNFTNDVLYNDSKNSNYSKSSYNYGNHGVLNLFKIHTWTGTYNLNVIQNLNFANKSLLNTDETYNINTGALIINGGLAIKKSISLGGNVNINKSIKVLNNLDVIGNIYNNGNTKIDNLLNTRLLLVKENSNFIGNINTNNININGISNIYNNLNIHGLTHITKNTIISNNLNIKKGNVYIDNLLNSRLLKITENTNLLGNLNINANTYINKNVNLFANLNIKYNIDVDNINIINKLHSNNLIIKENSHIKGNLITNEDIIIKNNIIVKKNSIIENLLVKNNSIFENNVIMNKNINILQNVNVFNDLTIEKNININNNVIIKNNLICYNHSLFKNDVKINNNLTVQGNIIITGDLTKINTRNIEIDDPIISIGNNINQTNKIYSGLIIKGYNDYIGIIRNNNIAENNNLYLVKNIKNENNININERVKLFVNNLNTSNISEFNGGLFKNKIYIPESISSDNIEIYKNLVIKSNLSVNDKFILFNTNSLHATGTSLFTGTTIFDGKTTIKGHFNMNNISTLGLNYIDEHIGANIEFNNNLSIKNNIICEQNIFTKNLISYNNFTTPCYDSNTSNKILFNNTGSIYFNKTSNLFMGHDTKKWQILGGFDPTKDVFIINNLNIEKNIICNQNIQTKHLITSHNFTTPCYNINTSDKNLLNITGSIYFNKTSNLFMGHDNIEWKNLGGLDPRKDATIINNLNVNKILRTNQLIIPNIDININPNINSNLYIKKNSNSLDELKIKLNGKENTIFLNSNPISYLSVNTDLFQFYNVTINNSIFGNRVIGLNDPAFNTFTKYYVIQEYIFNQNTRINGLEIYVTENIHNNTQVKLEIDIIKINTSNNQTSIKIASDSSTNSNDNFGNIPITQTKLINISNDILFDKGDKVKLSLKLLSNGYNDTIINGHEIFCRLLGKSAIQPSIYTLELNSPSDTSLISNGGAKFKKGIISNWSGTFTGCHFGNIITPIKPYPTYYDSFNNNIFKSGLIVSIVDGELINIVETDFTFKLSNISYDKTVIGVIQKNITANKYIINSIGEGGILITNINGDIKIGDLICSSVIHGYGAKQNNDAIMNYTVAKCVTNINWNNITQTISYNNRLYKIAFCSCIYMCG